MTGRLEDTAPENAPDISKRARILRNVLDFINHDDWEEGEGFLIFGSDAYDKHLGLDHTDGEPAIYDEFLRKLVSEAKKVGGADEIAKKISLSPASRSLGDVELDSSFEGLSPDQVARRLAEGCARNAKSDWGRNRNISDEIDASLAAEAIDQLETSYQRLVTLDEMNRPATPFDGSEYFEEAHRCELAGQKIAAVVLCRAVLEAALINATDQDGRIKSQTKSGSYIKAMLSRARLIGLIDGSRFRDGLHVRDAGNAAIHNLIQFHHDFADKIPQVIDSTRKILEDLFSPKRKA